MKCHSCHEEIQDHVRFCVVCGADVGFPNNRAALRNEEVMALALRVKEAEDDASVRGCETVLEKFRECVAQSSATINRSLGKISELISSDNTLFSTYYQAVGSEARLPENNEWDKIRPAVDGLLFPYYAENIRFGSLSIDKVGLPYYGDYCIVLKETSIKDRATVFEENSIEFIKKNRIVAGDPLPLGYRAVWVNRQELAVAKLGRKLTPKITKSEFPRLLTNSDIKNPDYIEVHIYGPIHRRAIKFLFGPEPRHKADKVLLKSVNRKLKEIGVIMEVLK